MKKHTVDSRRYGPEPLPAEEKRNHCVSSRLSAAELDRLDGLRGLMRRGEYLRTAALGRPRARVPPINRQAWGDLGRAAGNLHQIARRLNHGEALPLAEIRAELAEFRRRLLGARPAAEDEDDEESA